MRRLHLYGRLFSSFPNLDQKEAKECHLIQAYVEEITRQSHGTYRGFFVPADEYDGHDTDTSEDGT